MDNSNNQTFNFRVAIVHQILPQHIFSKQNQGPIHEPNHSTKVTVKKNNKFRVKQIASRNLNISSSPSKVKWNPTNRLTLVPLHYGYVQQGNKCDQGCSHFFESILLSDNQVSGPGIIRFCTEFYDRVTDGNT
jgi:hypothetical protein